MRRWVNFVWWLVRTPWPFYALIMGQANVVGLIVVFSILRFLIPLGDVVDVEQKGFGGQWLMLSYLAVAGVVGGIAGLRLIYPVLIWQRGGDQDAEAARLRALRIPALQAAVHAALWAGGGVTMIVGYALHSWRYALIIAGVALLGTGITCTLGYLQGERILRPLAVAALSHGVPENPHAPGIKRRLFLTWTLVTGIPVLGIIFVVLGQNAGIIDTDPQSITNLILLLASVALILGLWGMQLASNAISNPIRQLRQALRQIEAGNINASVTVADSTDLGLLQAGFNDMARRLAEREEMRDLFGRYVGEDVADQALEHGSELGGEEVEVAVLFVDLVGSTKLASTLPPNEVVALLNEFFRIVVDAVDQHGGFVNKFEGDAALAIFGAPVPQPDAAGQALRAARTLWAALKSSLPDSDVGIGVSAGRAIAGHVGAAERFEYTVIGDPVNEASRLTDLAKADPGRVLASATTIARASWDEATKWDIGGKIHLRGRRSATQLARPNAAPQLAHSIAGFEADETGPRNPASDEAIDPDDVDDAEAYDMNLDDTPGQAVHGAAPATASPASDGPGIDLVDNDPVEPLPKTGDSGAESVDQEPESVEADSGPGR